MNVAVRQTALGPVAVTETEGCLERLIWNGGVVPSEAIRRETPLLKEAFRQFDAYLAGRLRTFSLPLAPVGTRFQRQVWEVLRTIPYGATASYGAVAVKAGHPSACRAVGMACNRNPLPVFIPCHRVIGADGGLVGFGAGLALKVRLLKLEGWRESK